jgi:metal-responsive CopG/Arc/MetJ family transcriptional regulator
VIDGCDRGDAGLSYRDTKGMKTAISIPDEIFEAAERLARRMKKSRSQLFSDAVREYVARHAPEEVTEAMDRVCSEVQDSKDKFVSSATRRVLEHSEW